MRPVRFCMLTTFYPPYHFGGDGVGIRRLCHGLVRRGHEVTVVHDRDAYRLLSDGGEPDELEEPEGMRVVGLETGAPLLTELLTHQLGRPVVNRRRIQAVLDEGFDVVNYHNVSLVGGPALFSMGEGVKLCLAHEHWLVCPMHVLWRHKRELCTSRECLRCTLKHRRPPQLWRYTGMLERHLDSVDAFVAMSEFSREKHREFGFPRDMEVLPYFLPDPAEGEVHPEERPTEALHDRPYFLFVGRLERIKGLDDVIPLFERYPDADLVIAGDGTHRPELERLAAGNPRVRFLGRVSLDELERWYADAVALIVPSVCFETFGIILIESFRMRTPVIARRLGPFPEIVEASGGGELFETGDELLAAMRRLQGDPARREECAAAGQRAYRERWSESAVVPRYLDLVRRCAEKKGAADLVAALTAEEACVTP